MDYQKLAKKYRKKLVVDPEASTAVRVDYGQDEIQRILPHRPPFLLFDQIEAVDFEERTITGRRIINPEDPVFAGHFPGYAIYPGVLQVEMIGQLAICYYVFSRDGTLDITSETKEINVRALRINHALFQHELRPGDEAHIMGRVLEADEYTFRGIGQVVKGGQVCTVVIAEFYIVE